MILYQKLIKNHEKPYWPHYRMITLCVQFHTTPKRKSLIKFDSDLRSPKYNMFFNSARRGLSFKAIKNRGYRAQSKVRELPEWRHHFFQNHPKSTQFSRVLGHPTTKSNEKLKISKFENIKAFEKIPSRIFHPSWRYAKP